MPDNFALQLRTPLTDSDALVEDVTAVITEWRRSIRLQGGPWDGAFFLPLNGGTRRQRLSDSYLQSFFDNRLAFQVVERVGAPTWSGIVWAMDLVRDGGRTQVRLEDVWNAVRCTYTSNDGASATTGWYTDAASIARYGRRELSVTRSDVTATEAAAYAQKELRLRAWPQPQLVETGPHLLDREGLEVQVAGRILTANSRYVSTGDGSTSTIGDYASDIIATDVEFFSAGKIGANTLPRKKELRGERRAWDVLLEFAQNGDATYDPWRIYATNDGRLNYEPLDTQPLYEWHGLSRGGWRGRNGRVEPWQMVPGVARDMGRRRAQRPSSAFLADGRDFVIDEIEFGQGMTAPIFRRGVDDESSILARQAQYLRWLETSK